MVKYCKPTINTTKNEIENTSPGIFILFYISLIYISESSLARLCPGSWKNCQLTCQQTVLEKVSTNYNFATSSIIHYLILSVQFFLSFLDNLLLYFFIGFPLPFASSHEFPRCFTAVIIAKRL